MVKKAVIQTGGKQYLVAEGDEIDIDLLNTDKKSAVFDALLVFNGDKINIGKPTVSGVKVNATIINGDIKQTKVTSIRFKAKKRVRKVKGHRQRLAKIKINSIKS